MQYGNWYLAEHTERLRYDDMRREADRQHFMKLHDLDLWTVVRRALRRNANVAVPDVHVSKGPRVRVVPAR